MPTQLPNAAGPRDALISEQAAAGSAFKPLHPDHHRRIPAVAIRLGTSHQSPALLAACPFAAPLSAEGFASGGTTTPPAFPSSTAHSPRVRRHPLPGNHPPQPVSCVGQPQRAAFLPSFQNAHRQTSDGLHQLSPYDQGRHALDGRSPEHYRGSRCRRL